MERAFVEWRKARERGESIVVTANDNATVDQLARRIRADRLRHREIAETSVPINGGSVSVGDEIVTLHNDRMNRPGSGDYSPVWVTAARTGVV